MTQRLATENILSSIQFPTVEQLRRLESLLGEAQSRPPRGIADGSINEAAWGALRDIIEGFEQARDAAKTFRRELS